MTKRFLSLLTILILDSFTYPKGQTAEPQAIKAPQEVWFPDNLQDFYKYYLPELLIPIIAANALGVIAFPGEINPKATTHRIEASVYLLNMLGQEIARYLQLPTYALTGQPLYRIPIGLYKLGLPDISKIQEFLGFKKNNNVGSDLTKTQKTVHKDLSTSEGTL
ncbi:MAG TPA: hypothetical protein VHA52_05990 [Candidatus Babeliaceae bacterium]|nr:hypothetical protein [Candidatus Babeliaceae bacterium]